MRVNNYIVDQVLIHEESLNSLFVNDWEQKELKKYKKITEVIPVTEYKNIDNENVRNNIVKYSLSRVDKRCKYSNCIGDPKEFYNMLLIYKNTSDYKSSTAIELHEIINEFKNEYVEECEIINLIESLHHDNIITWETRADLNQIRFKM